MATHVYYKCLEYILKPVVKLCLKNSIKLQEVIEILKKIFVNSAKELLESENQQISTSRIHIMTGVHRQDIARIQSDPQEPKTESIITKVIGQWQHDKEFLHKKKPKVLTATGVESEFFKLVQKVNRDLNPYTILFELERIKAIKKTASGIELIAKEYVPQKDLETSYSLLGRDFNNFVAIVEENLDADRNNIPHHHIQTEYDQVPSEFYPVIKKWFYEQGILLHKKTREFLSKYDTDLNKDLKFDPNKDKLTVSFTSFSRIEKKDK